MSPALFMTTAVVANVNGVPTQPRASYNRDFRDVEGQHPTLVASCEAWSARARGEARKVLEHPPWKHHMPTKPNGKRGTSTMLAWRSDVWRELGRGVLELHGSVRNVCDVRELAWARLEHQESGRVIVVGSGHPAPTATKKGRREVRDAAAARDVANARLEDFLRRRQHPVLLLGDWNQHAGFLGEEVGGRRVRYAMDGILGVAGVDGAFAKVKLGKATAFPMVRSDHPGIRIRLGLTDS